MKILVNKCYGGFDVSEMFMDYWREKHSELGIGKIYSFMFNDKRTDPEVIALVEYLGEKANGRYSRLVVIEIPDTVTDWAINEYDGMERITYVVDGKLRYA